MDLTPEEARFLTPEEARFLKAAVKDRLQELHDALRNARDKKSETIHLMELEAAESAWTKLKLEMGF